MEQRENRGNVPRGEAEQDLNSKKEEATALFEKDKVLKEKQNTRISLLKLSDTWRTAFRLTRHVQLRNDITTTSQTFEQNLKSMDTLINCLVNDVEEAERWERLAQDSHLNHVQSLRLLQHKRLNILLQQWGRGLREVDFTLSKERQRISAVSEQQCARLEDLTFELQRQQSELETELQHKYDDIKVAYQCTHQERIAEVQEQHEYNLGLTEVQNREWVSPELAEQPSHVKNDNGVRESDVKKLQDAISQLKKTLNSSDRDGELEFARLRAAKDEVAQKTRKLQADMTQFHRLARKQLTELTIHSSDAIKKLRVHVAQGERILRLAKMCRKREADLERVLPSLNTVQQRYKELAEKQAMGLTGSSNDFDNDDTDRNCPDSNTESALSCPQSVDQRGAEQPQTLLDADSIRLCERMLLSPGSSQCGYKVVGSVYPEVEQIWQCYNSSVLQRKALRKEREHLLHESQELQLMLRQQLVASDEQRKEVLSVHTKTV